MGSDIFPNERIGSLDPLPSSRVILCDLTPCQLLKIAGARLSPRYRGKLARYRYGMGAFKIDYALSAPVPWKAQECARAATVNVGGAQSEIAASEISAWRSEHADKTFELVMQLTLFV